MKKNNPKLTWKRKVSSNYEEGGASVELVSKIKEYYRQFFYRAIYMVGNCIRNSYQQKDYIKVLHAMESMILKALREEDFGIELQQMSLLFSSDLNKFKLETPLKTLLYIYIYIYIYIGFACQQSVLKTFPGPGYLRSEDGVVWLWHSLENLYIYIYI